MIRTLAIVALWLYGSANIVAGVADLLGQHGLPVTVALGLLATGVFLVVAARLVQRAHRYARPASATALCLALVLALFNERVLGLGSPTHHLVRVPLTLAILWSIWRTTHPRKEER